MKDKEYQEIFDAAGIKEPGIGWSDMRRIVDATIARDKPETPAEIASRVHPYNDHHRAGLEQSLADE